MPVPPSRRQILAAMAPDVRGALTQWLESEARAGSSLPDVINAIKSAPAYGPTPHIPLLHHVTLPLPHTAALKTMGLTATATTVAADFPPQHTISRADVYNMGGFPHKPRPHDLITMEYGQRWTFAEMLYVSTWRYGVFSTSGRFPVTVPRVGFNMLSPGSSLLVIDENAFAKELKAACQAQSRLYEMQDLSVLTLSEQLYREQILRRHAAVEAFLRPTEHTMRRQAQTAGIAA